MKFLYLSGLAFIIFSCKNEKVNPPVIPPDDSLSISIYPVFGEKNLELDSCFSLTNQDSIIFTDIKFYMSELKNESSILFSNVGFFNYRLTGSTFLTVKGKSSDFKNLKGYLGVNEDNHKDPSAFPNDSPLNIMNCDGMHWGWNPGYSFIQIEAKADTINDGISNYNHSIVFHVGTDQFLQSFSYSNLNWISINNHLSSLKLKLDLKQMIENQNQPIDIRTEYMTHSGSGEEGISLKVIQNFNSALTPF